MNYSWLVITALAPVIVTVLLYLLNKKTAFSNIGRWPKQIIYGILFGIVAIFNSEFGIHIDGAIINTRDAAPLTAGLLFGAPAGIISGIIGAVERWFSVGWGGGEFMSFAGSLSTFIAGFFGAALRKWMFDDKKPSWYYGFATGFIMEILHMLMLFFINMNDVKTAFTIVEICFFPMLLSNSISVMLALLAVSALAKERKNRLGKEHRKLTQTFSRWLLLVVLVAFAITSVFTYVLQSSFSTRSNEFLLKLNIDDVKADIQDASDANLLRLTRQVAEELNAAPQVDNVLVKQMCARQENDFSEINIIDKNGIIIYTNTPEFMYFDMSSGEQSKAFMVLLQGTRELVQNYQPTTKNSVYMKYAGVALKKGGFVQVGYNAVRFRKDIDVHVIGATRNRHVGEKGYMIIAADDGKIVSDPRGNEGRMLEATGIHIDRTAIQENVRFKTQVHGESCYCMYTETEGYYIMAVSPVAEVLFSRNLSVYLTVSMGLLIFTVIFILLYFLIKKLVVENIHEINHNLKEITGGNLDVSVDVRTNEEFVSLSDDINTTVATLKGYIAQAAARIDKELEMAKIIQTSTLPCIFPPYPERTDFDIYANMDTAREVGGDFYDFYLLDDSRLAFLIADVSGKGITAAMFMMKAKTLIKGYAEKENQVVDILTKANEALCDGNSAEMFVTCWMGILNFTTHTVSYVNAGHNPPLVRHKGGDFEYFKSRPGFVLGGMEGVRYHQETLELRPGDEIYLYTDGITEATDTHNELYGEERLLKVMNLDKELSAKDICQKVKEDIALFVGKAPQFDDMTMLCLRLMPKNSIVLRPDASDSMSRALEFVENTLTDAEVPPKVLMKMNIAVDEIFSNIIYYSGADEAEIECSVHDGNVVLVFTDNGKPYNPLETDEPDTSAAAEDRKIGGLGIFMVRKSMDNVTYVYNNERNVLSLCKKFEDQK